MAGSALLYAGLLMGLAGAVVLILPRRLLHHPSRRRGAVAMLGLGLAVGSAAALLPAPERRAATPASGLDRIVPVWQFDERHEMRVRATPAEAERAVREVTAREIRFFRLLTWLRRPRIGSGPEDLLAPPADRPILEVALDSGFLMLDEEPGREVVFGALVRAPRGHRRLPSGVVETPPDEWTPERFRELSQPGYAKAVMAFRLVGEGGGWTRVITDTRVFATDPATARGFAVYWRLIYPGSSLIRRMWLAAIRARAETAAAPGDRQ